MRSNILAIASLWCPILFLTASAVAQEQSEPAAPAATGRMAPKPILAWAAKPAKLMPYVAPNKLVYRFADVMAAHKGKQSWAQTVVLSRDFIGQWISMAPGERTKTQFYADDRIFFVVKSGSMRVTIEGQEPFVATRGFLVQVPERLQYSIENVGSDQALRFEIRPSGEAPQYPITETPTPVKGVQYVQATYTGHGHYDDVNHPYIDFFKQIVDGGQKIGVWVRDDHTYTTILRSQHGVPTPPPTQWGHFHENFPEFWYIIEGTQQFLVEGEPLITVSEGDIAATPIGRWHRASPYGDGPSTRLAFIPRPGNLHYMQPRADAMGGD